MKQTLNLFLVEGPSSSAARAPILDLRSQVLQGFEGQLRCTEPPSAPASLP